MDKDFLPPPLTFLHSCSSSRDEMGALTTPSGFSDLRVPRKAHIRIYYGPRWTEGAAEGAAAFRGSWQQPENQHTPD